MKKKLTREQRIADGILRGFDIVESRLESSLVGLERAESARSSITSSIDAMGLCGGHRDKMAEALIRIDESIDDISCMVERFADEFAEIEEFITEIQRRDPVAGKILRLTYIDRLTVEEITMRDDTRYSKKTIYEYLKRGLDAAYDLLMEEAGYDRGDY